MSNRGRFDDCIQFAIEDTVAGDDDRAAGFLDQAWEIALNFGKSLAWDEIGGKSLAARKVALAAHDFVRGAALDDDDLYLVLEAAVKEWRRTFVETGDDSEPRGFVDETGGLGVLVSD